MVCKSNVPGEKCTALPEGDAVHQAHLLTGLLTE
jgi:hypothetical protein